MAEDLSTQLSRMKDEVNAKFESINKSIYDMKVDIIKEVSGMREEIRNETRQGYVNLSDFKALKHHIYEDIDKGLDKTKTSVQYLEDWRNKLIGAWAFAMVLGLASLYNLLKNLF